MLQKREVTSALKWQVLNISIQAILQFAFIMISARIFPKEIHGAYAIINSFIFVLSITSEGGMMSALIQKKEINETHTSIAFYTTLILSVLLFLLVAVFSGYVADFYDQKVTKEHLTWASLIFILKALGSISRSFLVRNFRFKEIFVANNVSFLLGNIILMYVLGMFGYGIYAIIFAFVGTQFIQSLIYYYYAQHSFKLSWGKDEYKYLFHFGSGSILLKTTNYLSSQVDKLLIGKFFSESVLAIYEKGQFISKMPPKYIGNSIDPIMFSWFSKMNEPLEKRKYFKLIFIGVAIVSSYFSIVFYFNADIIIRVILGKNWGEAAPFLQIFSFIIPAIILARLGDVIVRSENKMYRSLPVKLGFFFSLLAVILFFKSEPLLQVTKYIAIIYWLHCLGMTVLALNIIKLPAKLILESLVYPSIFCLVLIMKYFFITSIIFDDLASLFFNSILDLICMIALFYKFKDHPIAKKLIKQIKLKIPLSRK